MIADPAAIAQVFGAEGKGVRFRSSCFMLHLNPSIEVEAVGTSSKAPIGRR